MLDLLTPTTTGDDAPLVLGLARGGEGDFPPRDGAGSPVDNPVDMTGLPHTVVVTVVVVNDVVPRHHVAGWPVDDRRPSSSIIFNMEEITALSGDVDSRGGVSSAGGVWQATVLLGGPPPVACDVGEPAPLSTAAGGVTCVLCWAPGLFAALRVVTWRRCGASPIGDRIGGVRCRAPLFSIGTLAALEDLLGIPASGGVV